MWGGDGVDAGWGGGWLFWVPIYQSAVQAHTEERYSTTSLLRKRLIGNAALEFGRFLSWFKEMAG